MSTENGLILRMKDDGENLGTRALGERVRGRILEALRTSTGRVVLDFEGVRVMTQSFADETFRKLLEEIGETEARRLAVTKLSDDVRAVLRYATAKIQPTAPAS